MATITIQSIDNMTHLATMDHHGSVGDELSPSGDDLGMDPCELRLASLGT